MLVKAEVLQILHQIGVSDDVALKTVNLFSDVQDVIVKSRDRMEEQFNSSISKSEEIVETIEDGNTEVRPTE